VAQIELIGGPEDGKTFITNRLPQEWRQPLNNYRREIAIYALESINEHEATAKYIYKETQSPFSNQV
jgi:hypothetical protein